MNDNTLTITITNSEVYTSLSASETNNLFLKYGTKLKSRFGSNDNVPTQLKIRDSYRKTANYFEAKISWHYVMENEILIHIGPPNHPPKKQDFKAVTKVIADGLALEAIEYDFKKKVLQTDSELHARKVADLCDKQVSINPKWEKKPTEYYQFIVK